MDNLEYDTVLEAASLVSDSEADDLEDFMLSSQKRLRYVEGGALKVIYVKHGWIGNRYHKDFLFEDLARFFPNSGDAEKINQYAFTIDLGEGYVAEMESLALYGGSEDSWSVTIKKE